MNIVERLKSEARDLLHLGYLSAVKDVFHLEKDLSRGLVNPSEVANTKGHVQHLMTLMEFYENEVVGK